VQSVVVGARPEFGNRMDESARGNGGARGCTWPRINLDQPFIVCWLCLEHDCRRWLWGRKIA
jgi:hypothetical protein